MNQKAEILLVDDQASIRMTLGSLLQRAGYTVTSADGGEEAVMLLERRSFDLLLVDLNMPGMDGMQVIAAARRVQPDISVIVLTGHGSLESAIEGLHLRIFDYLLKTTEPAQVIERVTAALAARAEERRQRSLLDMVGAAVQELRGEPATHETESVGATTGRIVTVGALQMDTWRQVAMLGGRTLPLTPTEFRVLLYMAEHAGTMLPYTELVRCAQGYDTGALEAGELIKPHIHHLRQKLEPDPSAPRYIFNVRGKGYLFSPIGE